MRGPRAVPLDEEERGRVAAAWEQVQPLVRALAAKFPRFDVEGAAAEMLCRYLPTYRPDLHTTETTWAFEIVRWAPYHCAMAERPRGYRNHRNKPPFAIEQLDVGLCEPVDASPPPSGLDFAELLISHLPARDAEILWLWAVEGHSFTQIGARFGMSKAAVKWSTVRSRNLLKARLRRLRQAM